MISFLNYMVIISWKNNLKFPGFNFLGERKKQNQKIVIAVTALNAIDSPGPGIAVIRAIRHAEDF